MKTLFSLIISAALVASAYSQTRNVLVGTNNTVVQPTNFWSADASNARSGLGLGTAATNAASAFQPSSTVLSNLASSNAVNLTNLRVTNIVGWSALTNINSSTSLLGFTTNNGQVVANTGTNVLTFIGSIAVDVGSGDKVVIDYSGLSGWGGTLVSLEEKLISAGASGNWTFDAPISFNGTNSAPPTRTNLGLGATWLTNTNVTNFRTDIGLGWSVLTNTNTSGFNTSLYGSGTNPVLVSTSGVVVSPTNFWQVAPLVTTFIESQPTTNQTTNISAGRNLHIHSIAFSTVGITNTIALPTTNSFNGDIALVVHQGPTSSVTAVRTAGAATNLITLNRFEEAVEFVYYDNVWQFNHNPSFTEPIYFSGTNGVGHAAESRTNLGLPLAALTNSNTTNFQAAVFQTNTAPVSGGTFNAHAAWMEVNVITNGSNVSFRIPLYK